MKLFGFLQKRLRGDDNRRPAEILSGVLGSIPASYHTNDQYLSAREFLEYNEWGLALESLMELPKGTGDGMPEQFWPELSSAAQKMNMIKEAEYCREQIPKV